MSQRPDLASIRERVERATESDTWIDLHALIDDIRALLEYVEELEGRVNELIGYLEKFMDTDPRFPMDPRWRDIRAAIEGTSI